jgi:uncharacterized protein YdaT
MKKRHGPLFVEQHKRGWAVLQEHAQRASAVRSTQKDAISRAHEINPKAELHIQSRDGTWRKKNPFDPQ